MEHVLSCKLYPKHPADEIFGLLLSHRRSQSAEKSRAPAHFGFESTDIMDEVGRGGTVRGRAVRACTRAASCSWPLALLVASGSLPDQGSGRTLSQLPLSPLKTMAKAQPLPQLRPNIPAARRLLQRQCDPGGNQVTAGEPRRPGSADLGAKTPRFHLQQIHPVARRQQGCRGWRSLDTAATALSASSARPPPRADPRRPAPCDLSFHSPAVWAAASSPEQDR